MAGPFRETRKYLVNRLPVTGHDLDHLAGVEMKMATIFFLLKRPEVVTPDQAKAAGEGAGLLVSQRVGEKQAGGKANRLILGTLIILVSPMNQIEKVNNQPAALSG